MASASSSSGSDCKFSSNHFFKFLVSPGYTHKLCIPATFTERISSAITNIGESNDAILNSPMGGDKCCWHVELRMGSVDHEDDEQDQHEQMWFEQGWEDFVKDHELNLGDFLAFEHVGNLVFNVLIFDPSTCEKEYHITNTVEPSSSNGGRDPMEAAEAYTCKSQRPYFIAKFTYRHIRKRHNLDVPVGFARVNGLCDSQNGWVTMIRDDQGNLYWLRLLVNASNSRVHVRFGRKEGWIKFLMSQKVKAGDVCVFELDVEGKTKNRVTFDALVFRK